MTLDLEHVLQRIQDRQWALADIDWDAPGADRITTEQWPQLRAFMADLVWIEQVGARGFAALAHQATDPTLAEIYRYFHAEEQRHANAELALMHRWGMLANGEVPEPNINIRLAIDWLDAYADDLPMEILGTVIPVLEIVLDGALVKFLLDEVTDPVCHQAFAKINYDESRHLAIDFHVLEQLGQQHIPQGTITTLSKAIRPSILTGALMFVPLMSRMRDSIVEMGIDEQRLYAANRRFSAIGERNLSVARLPVFQAIDIQSRAAVNRSHSYQYFADAMVKLSSHYPKRFFRPAPAWINQLTYEPAA